MSELNIKAGGEDFQCLLSSPVTHNAVKWSEDNLLAISAEKGVSVLDPCDLSGARQYAAADEQSEEQSCGGHGPSDNLHARLVELRGPKNKRHSLLPSACMRCIDWSPQGCSESNTCLLGAIDEAVTTRVCIYAPPAGFKGQWEMAEDLSAKLLGYLEASGWREAVQSKPECGAADNTDVTRLRGGGRKNQRQAARTASTKAGSVEGLPHAAAQSSGAEDDAGAKAASLALFQPGSLVEVLNDEPGLADCWFPGKVAETSGAHLLVVYNNLQDEDSSQPLREWFPLPGSQHDLTIETAHTVHIDSRRYQVRPAPPKEVLEAAQKWSLGDAVEAFREGWWAGSVTEIAKGMATVLIPSSREVLSMPAEHVRLRLSWSPDGTWAPHASEVEKPMSGQKRSRGGKQAMSNKRAKAAEQAPASQSSSAQHDVPEDFDASCLGGMLTASAKEAETCIQKNAPTRFLQLRDQIPEEARQSYSRPREHLKGSDTALLDRVAAEYQAVHGAALAPLEITLEKITAFARQGLRKKWNPVHGLLEAEQAREHSTPSRAPSQAQTEGLGQDGSAPLTPVEEEDVAPLEELPEGRGIEAPAVLAAADASSKQSILDTFPLVFCLRWLILRNELPDDEWETYGKGQHLRGADAAFADQVLDELYQSFGEQVSAAGLTKKDILREGKRTVRQLCIQTGTPLKVPLSLINQYSLRPVYERLVELIARQFPNSNAIAPLPPPGEGPDIIKRRRKSVAEEEYQADLSAEAFEQRLFITSALQVAWSPAWAEGPSRYAMVAVSTKSGRVWLWRYHLPSQYSAAAKGNSLAQRFTLVGSFMAHASWVTALSWASFGSSLLLATGCAEGSVRLHAAPAATLSALPDAMADPSAGPADKAMLLVRVIAAPDLRQVTCMDLRTQISSSTGKTSVHLAIGKNAGMITAWTSSQASNLWGLEGKGGCGTLYSVQRGSYTIVGVAWAMPPTQAQDTAAVLTASAQDGSLSSWRWDGQQLQPCAAPQAPAGSQASTHTTAKGKPCRAFGLASSGNGLYVAVARETPYAKQLNYAGGHMFKKVWQGSVQLLQLAGTDGPLGRQVLQDLNLLHMVMRGLPFPAHKLWDIAAAVAAEEHQGLAEGEASALSIFQENLDSLQRSYGCQGPPGGLSNKSASAEHALQLSNALRRLVLKRVPSLDEELVLQMQQHIARNDFALLKQYIRMRLQNASEAASTMASWAGAHSDLNSAPREGAEDSHLQRISDALAEATSPAQDFGGVVVRVPRCPVTFQEVKGALCWHCVLCKRSFIQGPQEAGPPTCMFCGVAISRHLPSACLQTPGLC